MIDDTDSIEVICPACGKETRETVAWIEQGNAVKCNNCETENIIDGDRLREMIERLNKDRSS